VFNFCQGGGDNLMGKNYSTPLKIFTGLPIVDPLSEKWGGSPEALPTYRFLKTRFCMPIYLVLDGSLPLLFFAFYWVCVRAAIN